MPTSKEKLQTAKNETAQKQIRIDELEATEKLLSKQVEDITAERDSLLEYKTTTEPAYTISTTKLSEAQEQIRLMELSRFASAYKDQEIDKLSKTLNTLYYGIQEITECIDPFMPKKAEAIRNYSKKVAAKEVEKDTKLNLFPHIV